MKDDNKGSSIDLELLRKTDDRDLLRVFPGHNRKELRAMKNNKVLPARPLIEVVRGRKAKAKERREIDSVIERNEELEAAQDALLRIQETPQVFEIRRKERTKTSEATAFLIASDWHMEEEVKANTVNGLNSYNLSIMDRRTTAFFQNGLALVEMAQTRSTVNRIVLAYLGDFISGNIHDELMEGNLLLPADAIWRVQNILISGINFLLQNSKCDLIVPCHSGNHGRMTKKQRIATEAGNSLEAFMYHNLALHFEKEKRVKFMVAEGYHTFLDVYGYVIRFHHGHAIKFNGGMGGIYIPVNKAIAQWNKARRADLDIFGHFHQFRDGGNFICNGSVIGYNAFALSIKAEYERPQQAFLLVDSKRGKTLVAPILVDQ
jgi:hypothetical protein